jgi:hypothetical protein
MYLAINKKNGLFLKFSPFIMLQKLKKSENLIWQMGNLNKNQGDPNKKSAKFKQKVGENQTKKQL